MDTVVLSLGSNKGNREENIKQAVELLEEKFDKKFQKSPVYETPPLYHEGDEYFYNCCVIFECDHAPRKILHEIHTIENEMGRQRKEANAPRIIDIDIIFIDDKVVAEEDLIIPHPDMHNRLFVLQPLVDIAEDFEHPIMNIPAAVLLEDCEDSSKIEKVKNFW
ncbi:MAG: 2-amino-4-hydroxy-6-hydroxymethyldihydropteridine diphosphokinase [Elusimicrobiota bacterium]